MHSEALQDHCKQDDKGDDMTQVLIDRALAEATLRELNLAAVTYAALGKVILKDGAEAMRDKLSAALANAEPTGCTWTKDPDFEMGDTYDSSCGEKWSFIDGGPTENRVSFCQGCGKPVKIVQDTL